MKSCLLFDHDGVLVDTEEWYFRAGRRALAEVGLTLDREQYLLDMAQGRGTWVLAREAGLDADALERLRARRDALYQESLRTESIEIEGVTDTLAELKDSGIRMAIVTTAKRADFELIHADRQIVPFMELVLVRDDYEHAKPHPEPYLTALERLDVPGDDVLVVEDSARGLASAVAANLDCCVVRHEFTRTQDLSAARYRIDAIGDLPALVSSIQ